MIEEMKLYFGPKCTGINLNPINYHCHNIPDYITLVPDGEPTLDKNLGDLIKTLQKFGFPVAIITNSSLIPIPEVQDELMPADYVSIKIDAVHQDTWKMINRPHKKLDFDQILSGISNFANNFQGKLVTETMLLKNINDDEENIKNTAGFIGEIYPSLAYIGIPTRPTASKKAFSATESSVNNAFQIFKKNTSRVELLTGYEGDAFASTGDPIEDFLSIVSVHPMREDAALKYMKHGDAPRQGVLRPDSKGTIEVFPEYEEALYKLGKFDYIIVLYHLNQSEGWVSKLHPMGIKTNELHGLLATRTPRRPNPIGFGLIRLHKIEGNILHVSGMDAFDETPVLDIKPHLPNYDCIDNV